MEATAVASAIRSHRSEGRGRGSFEADALGLEGAYTVQKALADERERAGDAIIGYKLGLISAAKQEQMNVREPIIGHLHQSMVINPGEALARDRFIQPRVEPELGVVFGRDVASGASFGDLASAVRYVILAVDVLDSIYTGYRFGAFDVVADNASGGAVVLGNRPLSPDILWRREGHLRLALDGGEWVEGSVVNLGDPRRRIAWAAERLGALGRAIRAGDLLLLGAPCAASPLEGATVLHAEGPEASRLATKVV